MAFKVRITETMRGHHHFVDPELGEPVDLEFWFRIDWSGLPHQSFNPISSQFLTFDAEGVIEAAGLTDGERTCTGVLMVDYFRDQTITYELDFEAGGRWYHYTGQKVGVNLYRPLELVKTHTTCYGTVTRDDGRIVSRSVTHFEPDELFAFLSSVRLIYG